MAKSESEIERDLQSIVGSMKLSGFDPDEKTIERCRGILTGELDADEEIDKLFEKYRSETKNPKK